MLLWMDGFDHYGGVTGNMLNGSYANIQGATGLTTNFPRTGEYSLQIGAGSNDDGIRRVFGADYTTVGIGFAARLGALPGTEGSISFAEFRDDSNVLQMGIALSTSGQLILYAGNDMGAPPNGFFDQIILATSGQVLVAAAYQHFECRVVCDPVNGACEVRIDGVTVLNVTGVRTQGLQCATTNLAQVLIGGPGEGDSFTAFNIDDLFAWSSDGDFNNDFIGDKKVYTQMPSGDTSQQDWALSGGVSSAAILANLPPDDDAVFLEATTAGELTIVEVGGLPDNVVSIAAVMMVNRSFKTDAGSATLQVGLLNGSANADGASRPVTEAPTYYTDVVETDPATGDLWTVAGFNSANLFLERTG